jgi:hypothetical protein
METLPSWLEDVVAAAGMTAFAIDLDRKPGASAEAAQVDPAAPTI